MFQELIQIYAGQTDFSNKTDSYSLFIHILIKYKTQ